MKILVMCPGSFTHGLNSPERGESRWSQNYARMLAMAGHDVYGASMGYPSPSVHYGVKLIHETKIAENGPYDLYIDSSWWENKNVPDRIARKYVILKWALEEYIREKPLPENHYLAYPYPCHKHFFDKDNNPHNRDKCFALPSMFCTDFESPRVQSRRIFLPGKIDTNRPYQKFLDTVIDSIVKYDISGVASEDVKDKIREKAPTRDLNFFPLIPYNDVMDLMGQCRVNVPIMSPACVIEATVNGLASIFWREGEFFPQLSNTLNTTIETKDEPAKFTYELERLMNNNKFYKDVVRYSQDFFVSHRYNEALQYFNNFVESVF